MLVKKVNSLSHNDININKIFIKHNGNLTKASHISFFDGNLLFEYFNGNKMTTKLINKNDYIYYKQ